jgi:simple sugar transport system ATP-binding protein
MVGSELPSPEVRESTVTDQPILQVEGLSVVAGDGRPIVDDVSFTIRHGEVLGIAGVEGNGQSELVESVLGIRRPQEGAVRLLGNDITHRSTRERREAGVGYIPEDRHRHGLVLDFTLAENLALHDYRRPPVARLGRLSPAGMLRRARGILQQFDVRGGGPRTPAAALSGGNQQKVVIAREVVRDPRLLLAAQPTRGLDVGAIEAVHRRLVAERDRGRGVLLVSLELDEVLALADRILVIYEGRIVAEHGPGVSPEELGVAMTGGRHEAAAS